MENSLTLGTNTVFVCMLPSFDIHVNLIRFDRHFDYLHINVDTFVPRKPRVDRLGNIRGFFYQLANIGH